MTHHANRQFLCRLLVTVVVCLGASPVRAQLKDPDADGSLLPSVPDGFEITEFAREPLVRQPCSMAFDEHGRLFVGMGPQYRNPKPDTPGDSVVMIRDTDSDGVADQTHVFATGFNAIQGLAWRGRDLWVANAPDLTIVRDRDGDDKADEYVLLYTDLGNLEHGLHGLNWAPDGKLYMSKGNSKGLNQPGRYAPRAFRELWGMRAPDGTPDIPDSRTFSPEEYRHAYHDPADDWGLYGGILRCDPDGQKLEIVCRGFRNPWDITYDSGFNWLGTDNDQTQGDRVFMSIEGGHFGWNHPWFSTWGDVAEGPTAPVSGPLFEGSGTGIVFHDDARFPPGFRGVFFVNDWLSKTTYLWRPVWDGAMLRPENGEWTPFVRGGKALYRPTDIEVGPDGALWILGWSSGYGAVWEDGQMINEGRIYRIAAQGTDVSKSAEQPVSTGEPTISTLLQEFRSPLPVRRINAQLELLSRGVPVGKDLVNALNTESLNQMQETWVIWTLGQLPWDGPMIEEFLLRSARPEQISNRAIQSLRVLSRRSADLRHPDEFTALVRILLKNEEPRFRFEAVQAIRTVGDRLLVPPLLALVAKEQDRATRYAGWQTLRKLLPDARLKELLEDHREGVRSGALMGLLESQALDVNGIQVLAERDDGTTSGIARQWLDRATGGGQKQIVKGPPLSAGGMTVRLDPITRNAAVIRRVRSRSGRDYPVRPAGLRPGVPAYSDRNYQIQQVPEKLIGADLIQTANDDEGSRGDRWLTAELLVPARVWVAVDTRLEQRPDWMQKAFSSTELEIVTDDCRLRIFESEFPAGPLVLGGNTNDGREGGKSNYIVALQPMSLSRHSRPPELKEVLSSVADGDVQRGRLLFEHPALAGCSKCHSLDRTRNGFGPNLGDIGRRSNVQLIAQSILTPSAVITEGFNRQIVVTDAGKVHAGILLEESGLSVSLGQSTGERLTIPKARIEERRSDRVSAMPEIAELLTAEDVADLVAFLLTQQSEQGQLPKKTKTAFDRMDRFGIKRQVDRLVISHGKQNVAHFVFRDPKILRPYLSNVHAPGGNQVTRKHPPIPDSDGSDHATMHPGIWFGFGDINGVDFWRNRGRIRHLEFLGEPEVSETKASFSTRSELLTEDGRRLGWMDNSITLSEQPGGWLIDWVARFRGDGQDLVFGDQEEMGFGARLATDLTEKRGGRIRSSTGRTSAAETWGQVADWCDYSGRLNGTNAGICLLASRQNFRPSWWHNRNYGVFVANPFGRAAMKQGPPSAMTVRQGSEMKLRFAALVYDSRSVQPETAWQVFEESSQ